MGSLCESAKAHSPIDIRIMKPDTAIVATTLDDCEKKPTHPNDRNAKHED